MECTFLVSSQTFRVYIVILDSAQKIPSSLFWCGGWTMMDASPHLSKIAFLTVPHLKRQLVTCEHFVVVPHWCRTGAGKPACQIFIEIPNHNKYTTEKSIQRFRAHFLLLFVMSSFSDRNTGWNSRT